MIHLLEDHQPAEHLKTVTCELEEELGITWTSVSDRDFVGGSWQDTTFMDCSLHTFNIFGCCACWWPSRTWTTFNRFLPFFEVIVPHFYLCCTHWIIQECLNHSYSFQWQMFKFATKLNTDSLIYFLSHLQCHSYTVFTFTQLCTVGNWGIMWDYGCSYISSRVLCQCLSSSVRIAWPVLLLFIMAECFWTALV